MNIPVEDVVVERYNASTGAVAFRFTGAKGLAAEKKVEAMTPAEAGGQFQMTGFAATDESVPAETAGGAAAADDGEKERTLLMATLIPLAIIVAATVVILAVLRSRRRADDNLDGAGMTNAGYLFGEGATGEGDSGFGAEMGALGTSAGFGALDDGAEQLDISTGAALDVDLDAGAALDVDFDAGPPYVEPTATADSRPPPGVPLREASGVYFADSNDASQLAAMQLDEL
jgi:hypothetical protein